MAKVGFIGLGIMGRPMAGHLQAAGHELALYDRFISPPPQELTDGGAAACASGKEVTERSEVIIIMVPDTPDVDDVLFGPDGVAEGLAAGKIVVDMSSISPIATKGFAAKVNDLGCQYLDGPVSGGEVGAKAASLTIMVGGPEDAFAKVKPLFELMGKNITLIGGNGDGQTCKVANQIIVALTIEAVGEGAAVRLQGRRRSRHRAPGPDGGFRVLQDPRGARGTHDQAHLRPGFPHPAAPEGPQPRPAGGARPPYEPAQHRHLPGAVQRLRGAGRRGLGPLGDGPRSRAARQP